MIASDVLPCGVGTRRILQEIQQSQMLLLLLHVSIFCSAIVVDKAFVMDWSLCLGSQRAWDPLTTAEQTLHEIVGHVIVHGLVGDLTVGQTQ